jgi:hypothetical protein
MSPLDDELRSVLHAHAGTVTPSPDPLAGVERRAHRMRRNRAAAAAGVTALAVAAVAFAVPALVPGRDHDSVRFATTPPSVSASPSTPAAGPDRLDPQHPWAFRGDSLALGNGVLDAVRSAWATRHPGSTLSPLFGQVYEPAARPEVVFVSHADGGDRWGVATTRAGGATLLADEPLPADPTVLMAALPGDEVPRLLVVAGPDTGDMSYALDGLSFHTRVGPVPGVTFIPLEGDTSHDAVRVLSGQGNAAPPVFEGPAPDAPPSAQRPTGQPANALQWAPRGTTPSAALMDQATSAFAQAAQVARADVTAKVLYAGITKDGWDYVLFQAWAAGQPARLAGFQSSSTGGTPFYGPVIGKEPPLLAYVATLASGRDLLVLVPQPGVGRVLYATSSTAALQAVASGRSDLNPVGLVDRDPKAMSDRVEVHAGDDSILLRSPVQALLCGATSCG